MKLKILGSSSSGNGYILDNGNEALLIECGVPFQGVQKAVDFDISRIAGCIISHEHGDHAKHIHKVLDARIPCYMSAGTAATLGLINDPLAICLDSHKPCGIGGFKVMGFDVQHDASEPFGYLIHHDEIGTMLFATDTYYLKYKFAGLSNVLIECNYSTDILEANVEAGRIPIVQRNRTLKSHMSYDTCLETLQANDLSKVNNIVLIHLSDGNSNAEEFRQGIAQATCKSVHIASASMEIEFNRTPF